MDWRVCVLVDHLSRDVLPSPIVLGLEGLSNRPYLAFRSSRSSALIMALEPSDPNKSSPWAASAVMPLRSILQIQLVTLSRRAWKKSSRAAQDLHGLEESGSSQGNSIRGIASKASQSMSYSHKVSLQKLQLGPGMEVFGAGWLCGGGSVGPAGGAPAWTGRAEDGRRLCW